MKEISGGAREIPSAVIALFRRYRTRIPSMPGLWRISVLQLLAGEEVHPSDPEKDDLEASGHSAEMMPKRRGGEEPLADVIRANLAVVLLVAPPLFMMVVGGKRVSSEDSCEEPVGTLVLLDGLLLFFAGLGGGGFMANRRHFSGLVGTWLLPILCFAFLAHVALVTGLLVSIARVDRVGDRRHPDDGKDACSSGTFAWGIFFLVVHLFCLVAPPVAACVRCWDKATKSTPMHVIPDEDQRHKPVGDGLPS